MRRIRRKHRDNCRHAWHVCGKIDRTAVAELNITTLAVENDLLLTSDWLKMQLFGNLNLESSPIVAEFNVHVKTVVIRIVTKRCFYFDRPWARTGFRTC